MSLCAEPSKQAQTEDLGREYDNTGKNEPCFGHSLDVTAQMLSSWVPVADGWGQEKVPRELFSGNFLHPFVSFFYRFQAGLTTQTVLVFRVDSPGSWSGFY